MRLDPTTGPKLELVRRLAETTLANNLMPFWAEHSWDEVYGGFLTRLDRQGHRLDDSEKVLMMQVRMIYALASAHAHGLTDRGYLELAHRGFDYLVQRFWDGPNGGFHFSLTRDGKPKSKRKNTDFHAYAMTGLAEYYRASKRREALEWAGRVFDVLMEKAADRDRGFVEDFDGGDWPALNDEQMGLGGRRGIKTIDMHTNMLEGFAYLARETRNPKHLEALRAAADLICTKGIHRPFGCTITAFDADWNPVPDGQGKMTTSYGINVELAWLLLEAACVLNEPREIYGDTVLGLIEHTLDFGFDHARGGLVAFGPLTGAVDEAFDLPESRMLKSWWAQAEMLNALVSAIEWTGEETYIDAFLKQFGWIWSFQIDHQYGDWYQDCHWDTGQPTTTDKGNEFKTAFHAGRALIRVSEGLARLFGGAHA